MTPHGASLALLVAVAATGAAQFTNWQKGQISTEICIWEQPRAALIRDIIYLDGGTIWWLPRMDDGTLGAAVDNGNNQGVILNYNLSTPFDSDTNVTAILLKDKMSKARGGSGNSNGAAPNYIDGGMLANDDEFFLYGGVILREDELYPDPDADEVLSYQAYQYGPEKETWEPGFDDGKLDNDVTRYIAYGAAVNAPSENKAWYFSGLRSPTFGTIFSNALNDTVKAVNVSNTLIELDMAEQLSETWTNKTLPKAVQGRSNAEVVWVPVGKDGILVVLGGVVYPEWAGRSGKSPDKDASEDESPKFMSTIDVYDVANDKWYQQPTNDGPKTRARGCAVVAAASDHSSFNIFYYGGFDGVSPKDPFSDEVWALSLPSFTWTKINEGVSLHGRAGHKCFMPYADQMMVLGGYTPQAGTSITCLDGGPVVLFNVSSGKWMGSYDPSEYADYGVHEKIRSKIGGDAAGGATATKPSDGWATSALGEIFDTSYDTDKITTYWPYASATSTKRPDIGGNSGDDDNDDKGGGGSGLPKWVAPVLGVVLGLMVVTGAIVIFCLYRRRKIFRNRSSEDGTEDAGMRIISWMRGQPTEKAPTITTSEDTQTSPDMSEARAAGLRSSHPVTTPPLPVEMADTQRFAELADTSPRPELQDTGLSPIEIIQKHSHFAEPKSTSLSDPSYNSFSLGQDHASSVSRSSAAADSAAIVSSSPDNVSAPIASNTSPVSDAEAPNLHRLSDGPASPRSDADDVATKEEKVASDMPSPAPPTPVSPPSVGENIGQDYISSRAAVSPLRKSVFLESEEDMGKEK